MVFAEVHVDQKFHSHIIGKKGANGEHLELQLYMVYCYSRRQNKVPVPFTYDGRRIAGPQVTNATGLVSQRCCDGRNVAFTLVSKYTVRFRKHFHRLYGIEHEVLHLRRTRLSLGTNNANTRLKTQVLCLFFAALHTSCFCVHVVLVASALLVAKRGGTAFRRPLPRTLDLSVKTLRPLLAVCHAHSTRVLTALPARLGYEV